MRVVSEGGTVRVVACANAAGAHMVGFAAAEMLGCLNLPRQGFQGFHHRTVVGRVHDGAGGVGDEVQRLRGWAFAVEFGEKRKHAAAQCRRRKGFASRGVKRFKVGRGWVGATGQHRLQMTHRAHAHMVWCQAHGFAVAGHLHQFLGKGFEALHHHFQRDRRMQLRRKLRVLFEQGLAVVLSWIKVAHQKTRGQPFEQGRFGQSVGRFFRRHAKADRGHALAGDCAKAHPR